MCVCLEGETARAIIGWIEAVQLRVASAAALAQKAGTRMSAAAKSGLIQVRNRGSFCLDKLGLTTQFARTRVRPPPPTPPPPLSGSVSLFVSFTQIGRSIHTYHH